jgi:hypothetical protein
VRFIFGYFLSYTITPCAAECRLLIAQTFLAVMGFFFLNKWYNIKKGYLVPFVHIARFLIAILFKLDKL